MNFQNLSVDEKKQLREYLSSIKEIQSEVGKLLEKCGYKLKENDGKTNPDVPNNTNFPVPLLSNSKSALLEVCVIVFPEKEKFPRFTVPPAFK